MEEFKKKLEQKVKLFAIVCCFFPMALLAAKRVFGGQSDYAQGLSLGVYTGSMLVVIYYLARNFAALRDEEKLKKLYIESTDERNNAIAKETMTKASSIFFIISAFASIVTGFFNETISITLAAVVFGYAIITICVSAYYNKKI